MNYLEILKKDKKLLKIIQQTSIDELEYKTPIHLALIRSIVSQQLSTKVASVIYGRLIDILENGGQKLTDFELLNIQELRSVGLSQQKANYIFNVIGFFNEHKLNDKILLKKSDEELYNLFLSIKGVGKWTVQMILMFAMKRENIFPEDDLGIQQSMTKLYKIEYETKNQLKEKIKKIAQKWEPYKTYACIYLWRWKDNK